MHKKYLLFFLVEKFQMWFHLLLISGGSMRIKAIILALALVIDFSSHAVAVKVFSGSIGAEVSGIDLSQGVEKEEISLIHSFYTID